MRKFFVLFTTTYIVDI